MDPASLIPVASALLVDTTVNISSSEIGGKDVVHSEICSDVLAGKSEAVATAFPLGKEAQLKNWKTSLFPLIDSSLQFFTPAIDNGEVQIAPPIDVYDEGDGNWNTSIVAQFIGKNPNFSYFVKTVKLLWGKDSNVEVKLAGDNLFVIRFSNSENRDWVLENGPWHIHNRPLLVRKWAPGLQFLHFAPDRMPIWFHLSHVPLELFTRRGLSYIASALGKPLYMDRITAAQQRLVYAKVCVEVDVSFEIPSSIPVVLRDGSVIQVAVGIPWMPQRCFNCRSFGHEDKTCPRKPIVQTSKVWIPKKQEVVASNASTGIQNSEQVSSSLIHVEGVDQEDYKGKNIAQSDSIVLASSAVLTKQTTVPEGSFNDDVGCVNFTNVEDRTGKAKKRAAKAAAKASQVGECSSSVGTQINARSGSVNKFQALATIDEADLESTAVQNETILDEEFLSKTRKPRAAAAGVKQLMQALKPPEKVKDKAKSKQVRAVLPASGVNLPNLST